MDPTFIIIVLIIIAFFYFGRRRNGGEAEKKLSNKINEIKRGAEEQEKNDQEKMKDFIEKNLMRIRVIKDSSEHEGVTYDLIVVQVKGYYFLEKENTPTIFALHILDKTFEGEDWHPVCSHLGDFTNGEDRVFEMKTEEALLGPENGVEDWVDLFVIPETALLPPLKGKRNLLFEVYLCDPKSVFKGGVLDSEPRDDFQYSFAPKNFEFEYDEVGWMDEWMGRDRVDELIMQLAYAVAAADGKVEKSEHDVVLKWAQSMLIFEKEEDYESKRDQMLSAAKKAHDLAVAGDLDIGVITSEMMEIAPKSHRYDAVELMLDVCVGDEDVKQVENEKIEQAVKLLDLDWTQYKVMREKRLADVKTLEQSEKLDEDIFGIKEEMTKNEKCKELRRRYTEFKSLTMHDDANKRKQALHMIERIMVLRKKYKC